MLVPIEKLAVNYGGHVLVERAHSVIFLYDLVTSKSTIESEVRLQKRLRNFLDHFDPNQKMEIYLSLRDASLDIKASGDKEEGERYKRATDYFRRNFINHPFKVIEGKYEGPRDYHRKSHPMREVLQEVKGGRP